MPRLARALSAAPAHEELAVRREARAHTCRRPVAARRDDDFAPHLPEQGRKMPGNGGLPAPSNRQIAHAENRPVRFFGLFQPRPVEP